MKCIEHVHEQIINIKNKINIISVTHIYYNINNIIIIKNKYFNFRIIKTINRTNNNNSKTIVS